MPKQLPHHPNQALLLTPPRFHLPTPLLPHPTSHNPPPRRDPGTFPFHTPYHPPHHRPKPHPVPTPNPQLITGPTKPLPFPISYPYLPVHVPLESKPGSVESESRKGVFSTLHEEDFFDRGEGSADALPEDAEVEGGGFAPCSRTGSGRGRKEGFWDGEAFYAAEAGGGV